MIILISHQTMLCFLPTCRGYSFETPENKQGEERNLDLKSVPV